MPTIFANILKREIGCRRFCRCRFRWFGRRSYTLAGKKLKAEKIWRYAYACRRSYWFFFPPRLPSHPPLLRFFLQQRPNFPQNKHLPSRLHDFQHAFPRFWRGLGGTGFGVDSFEGEGAGFPLSGAATHWLTMNTQKTTTKNFKQSYCLFFPPNFPSQPPFFHFWRQQKPVPHQSHGPFFLLQWYQHSFPLFLRPEGFDSSSGLGTATQTWGIFNLSLFS